MMAAQWGLPMYTVRFVLRCSVPDSGAGGPGEGPLAVKGDAGSASASGCWRRTAVRVERIRFSSDFTLSSRFAGAGPGAAGTGAVPDDRGAAGSATDVTEAPGLGKRHCRPRAVHAEHGCRLSHLSLHMVTIGDLSPADVGSSAYFL